MSFVNSISDFCHSWERNMPQDKTETIVKSALGSFVISLFTVRDANIALFIGAVAATASLIHALITPFFKAFLKRDYVEWYESTIMIVVNLSITEYVVNSVVSAYRRVDFISNIAITALLITAINYARANQFTLNHNTSYFLF